MRCSRVTAPENGLMYRRLPLDELCDLLHRLHGLIWQSAGGVGREIQQEIRLSLLAIAIDVCNDLRILRLESFPPKPTVHGWHWLVGWTGGCRVSSVFITSLGQLAGSQIRPRFRLL